jgi:hypothetical protein
MQNCVKIWTQTVWIFYPVLILSSIRIVPRFHHDTIRNNSLTPTTYVDDDDRSHHVKQHRGNNDIERTNIQASPTID